MWCDGYHKRSSAGIISLQGRLYETEHWGDMAKIHYQLEKDWNIDVSPVRRPHRKYKHNFKYRDGDETRIYINSGDEDPFENYWYPPDTPPKDISASCRGTLSILPYMFKPVSNTHWVDEASPAVDDSVSVSVWCMSYIVFLGSSKHFYWFPYCVTTP